MTFQEKNKALRLLKQFLQLNKEYQKCLSLPYTMLQQKKIQIVLV